MWECRALYNSTSTHTHTHTRMHAHVHAHTHMTCTQTTVLLTVWFTAFSSVLFPCDSGGISTEFVQGSIFPSPSLTCTYRLYMGPQLSAWCERLLPWLLQEWIEFFSGEEMMHPVTNRPMDKRSFIPSKWEKLKVRRHFQWHLCRIFMCVFLFAPPPPQIFGF